MNHIILDQYLEVGDRVRCTPNLSDPDYHYHPMPVPADTLGTVVAFHWYTTYHGHKNRSHPNYEIGTFQRRGPAYVKWDTGLYSVLDPHNSSFADSTVRIAREQIKQQYKPLCHPNYMAVKIGELPDLPYAEGDVVLLDPKSYHYSWFLNVWESEKHNPQHTPVGHVEICHIDYHYMKERRDDGSPMPIYRVRPAGTSMTPQTIENHHIKELVNRGPYWMYDHDPQALANYHWASLEAEASFRAILGQSEQVRNPETGDYSSWPLELVLHAVAEDKVDCIQMGSALFSPKTSTNAYRFTDRDLGRRLRLATFEGFKDKVQELGLVFSN